MPSATVHPTPMTLNQAEHSKLEGEVADTTATSPSTGAVYTSSHDIENSYEPARVVWIIQYIVGWVSYPWRFLKANLSELVLVLSAWFVVNLLITIYNKATFQFAHFNYPMITTAIHLFCTLTGVVAMQQMGFAKQSPKLKWDATYLHLVWFSLLFTGNIWLSNWSVMVASLPLNQILRASVPLFTVAINVIIFRQPAITRVLPPIFMVIVGCCLTVTGDLSTGMMGLLLVIVSCAISSLKGVVTQRTQVNQGLGAFDVLRYMCPLALIELLIGALLSGELQDLLDNPDVLTAYSTWLVMLGAGVLAFLVNVLSFRAVVVSDPLSMNVLANLKQVITSFLAIPLFGSTTSPALYGGIVIACIGSYWYGRESHMHKQEMKAQQENEARPAVDAVELGQGDEETEDSPSRNDRQE